MENTKLCHIPNNQTKFVQNSDCSKRLTECTKECFLGLSDEQWDEMNTIACNSTLRTDPLARLAFNSFASLVLGRVVGETVIRGRLFFSLRLLMEKQTVRELFEASLNPIKYADARVMTITEEIVRCNKLIPQIDLTLPECASDKFTSSYNAPWGLPHIHLTADNGSSILNEKPLSTNYKAFDYGLPK